MMVKIKNEKNLSSIRLPENNADTILSIVKKYGLEKRSKEIMAGISTAKTMDEIRAIFKNLPEAQISKTIREIIKGEIRDRITFFKTLQKLLGVSEEIARNIVQDIEKDLLNISGIFFDEKLPKTVTEREDMETKMPEDSLVPGSHTTESQENDPYREKIEE